MGQAKLRKLAGTYPTDPTAEQIVTIQSAAIAVGKVVRAASDRRGRDCVLHALVLADLLKPHNISAKAVIGFAAWRVGRGDGDVVAHHPAWCTFGDDGDFAGHCWVQVGKLIIDPTTWSLQYKLAAMDALDGRSSTFEWGFGDALITRSEKTQSLQAVTNAYGPAFYYEESLAHRRYLDMQDLDQDLVVAANLLMRNPGAIAVGPGEVVEGVV